MLALFYIGLNPEGWERQTCPIFKTEHNVNETKFIIQNLMTNWRDYHEKNTFEEATKFMKICRESWPNDEWRIIERTSIIRETILPDPDCKYVVWEGSDFGAAAPISSWFTKEAAERELKRLIKSPGFGLHYSISEKKDSTIIGITLYN